MSNVSPPADFDFWEFVCCGRCQLPFSIGNKAVPFWLTDCGHVICNNHLSVDQSCSQCGSQGIQLVPLQLEMDAPMSDWFHSIPMALDTVAFAAKFQQETMGSQIRYYRSRHQQQRALIERMKRDIVEAKKANEELLEENAQLRQHLQHPQNFGQACDRQSPSSVHNINGKRQMMEEPQYGGRHQGRPKTKSSPLSALGPARLTLPQGQQPPQLSSTRHQAERGSVAHMDHPQPESQRPATGLNEQYAYVPPSTPQYIPQKLSHTQAAPQQFQRSKVHQEVLVRQTPSQAQQLRGMAPPPTPVRFKPAEMSRNSNKGLNQVPVFSSQTQTQNHPDRRRQQRSQNMGPPPTPGHMRQQQSQNPQATQGLITSSLSHPDHQSSQVLPSASRFVTPTQHFAPPSTANQSQRPQPSTPSIGGPQRFMPPGYRPPSRAISLNKSGSGQRVPFVPGGQGPDYM